MLPQSNTSNQVHQKESQIFHGKYSCYSLMNNYSENYTQEYKKAFQYDAFRPSVAEGVDILSSMSGRWVPTPLQTYPPLTGMSLALDHWSVAS